MIERLQALQLENEQLHAECESLKSQLALASDEGRKAQRVLADQDHARRSREQAVLLVERALQRLSTLSA